MEQFSPSAASHTPLGQTGPDVVPPIQSAAQLLQSSPESQVPSPQEGPPPPSVVVDVEVVAATVVVVSGNAVVVFHLKSITL